MAITGLVSGMAVHYAGCCHPLPGDPIVGIVTTGKGVTIHTKRCSTLDSFAATPERFIDVDWDYAAGGHAHGSTGNKGSAHTGRISVIAANEPTTLGNLTNAVARQDGSVTNLKIVNRQQDFIEILVDVDVRDLRHLSMVIAGLRAVAGLTQVERANA
jgi:GTP pyrophosphokinase